ncbi:hypothetical protein ACH4E7_43180 [Kitasatospora sp. NPDC018058]|uniref:hypothetical protein n=1 Tax=Kitasatospora sp. NPDC018058 TaxID=3364025 RepID=UPI0037C137F8
MPGIHHQVSRPTAAPGPAELGRFDWVVLGTSMIAAGAVKHALSGVVAIAKDMVRPAPDHAPASDRPAPAADLSVNERDGWILISALFITTAAVAHAAARVIESVRAAMHPTHPRIRA